MITIHIKRGSEQFPCYSVRPVLEGLAVAVIDEENRVIQVLNQASSIHLIAKT